jgi:hypothetical protein
MSAAPIGRSNRYFAVRDYGQVQTTFWGRTTSLSDRAKLLALYLLTGPHSTGLGCFRLPYGYVVADLGWTQDSAKKAFAELSRNGFADRFEDVAFIPNFLKFNGIANPNVAVARQKEYEALPNGEAKWLVAGAMLTFGNHWQNGFETVLETDAGGFAKQKPTQPNPNPKESLTKPTSAEISEAEFDELKSIYPDRAGDQQWNRARKAAHARLQEGYSLSEILDGIRRYANFCVATNKVGTEFVKQAATFCGPDKPFLETWGLPASKADIRLAANLFEGDDFMRRTEESA